MTNITQQEFEQLFENFFPRLLSYATRLVGENEAEDVVEDVFAYIWEHRSTIDFVDNISSLLYRAVFTQSMNRVKHRRITQEYYKSMKEILTMREQFSESGSKWADRLAEDNDIRQLVEKAMEPLPARTRKIFRMGYLQGMKNKEIADTLNCPVRTVEGHIYRALKVVRDFLSKVYPFFITLLITQNIIFS